VIQSKPVASHIRIVKLVASDFQCSKRGVPAPPHKQLLAGKRVNLKTKEIRNVRSFLRLQRHLLHSLAITILMKMEERARTLCGTTVGRFGHHMFIISLDAFSDNQGQ
jgi:hypothetical protein